ncbi:LPS export ABC transporter permease LptG [Acidocella facilis]|uniref:LPS export ABC transporter permease LptG n=1 Tax=Acidocella facilis TaxID=525 RepID=UPI001F1E1C0F|nr:LPS export ABC transporter permease LptG [Acidocella facilis]
MQLDRYVGWVVGRAFLLFIIGLTALFSLLSFVEQLGLVGQGHYTLADALSYTALTAPDRLLQLAPVSMLLASLLGLGSLAKSSELTAFRSFGVSQARIVGAVAKLCLPIILALFLLAQFVIPPAQQAAQRAQAAALGDALPGMVNGGFWAQKDGVFLNVQSFADGHTLHGVSIYTLAPDGTLRDVVQADDATPQPDGSWALSGVHHEVITHGQVESAPAQSLSWKPFLSTRQLQLLAIPPETMPPLALYAYLRQLQAQHQQALRYQQTFWSMVAVPLSLFGMALIAAPFVFGPQRAGGAGRQIVIGALLGMVYLLVQQITGYLGLLLAVHPAIAALAPSLVLLGVGGWLLERSHSRLGRGG